MILLTPDAIHADELDLLAEFIWTLPDGELREALAYLHDELEGGMAVVVGAIEERP